MPTPIGHALAGLGIAGAFKSPEPTVAHIAVLAFCAAAPDLDLTLSLIDGANHHRGPSHSFVAALLAGFVGLGLRLMGVDGPSPWSISAAWASHVVLDYFGLDTSLPIGEMALWPFSTGFFASSVPVFYDVSRSFSLDALRHNTLAVALEVVILGPVPWLCWRRTHRA